MPEKRRLIKSDANVKCIDESIPQNVKSMENHKGKVVGNIYNLKCGVKIR